MSELRSPSEPSPHSRDEGRVAVEASAARAATWSGGAMRVVRAGQFAGSVEHTAVLRGSRSRRGGGLTHVPSGRCRARSGAYGPTRRQARGSRKGSPGEQRAVFSWQRLGDATDSSVEQGLEVAAGSQPVERRGGNRPAVTLARLRERGRLWRVRHRWESPQPSTARCHGGGGNTVNPMVGSGMQQARAARGGGTRQGGEKPRRRPADGR